MEKNFKSLFSNNRVAETLGIDIPIIQAGMVWCSGWELASSVSNYGGLGIIGSGSMYPDQLRDQVRKCKGVTQANFGVNIPLIYPQIDDHIQVILEEEVPVVFSSAGNPNTWTKTLQAAGIKVVHVVSSLKFALKAQDAGVDAVVGEGFEAGGHNGREETTTLVLIPSLAQELEIPVIAAGGISSGKSMLAAFALGAEGVQIGSRFVASKESSAHENFKKCVIDLKEGGTQLSLKELTPVRLVKNDFFQQIQTARSQGASVDDLRNLLGRGRAKRGMFEGDMIDGELEIGQVAANFSQILSASEILDEILGEFSGRAEDLNSRFAGL